jgi:hypothetical protein
MASELTNYGVQYLAQIAFGQAITPVEMYFIALCDQTPNRGSTGDTISEFTAESYQRASIPNDTTNWTLSSYSTMYNANEIDYPIAVEDWGTGRYYAICDSLTGGNVIGYGGVGLQKFIGAGDQAILLPGCVSFNVYIKPTGIL